MWGFSAGGWSLPDPHWTRISWWHSAADVSIVKARCRPVESVICSGTQNFALPTFLDRVHTVLKRRRHSSSLASYIFFCCSFLQLHFVRNWVLLLFFNHCTLTQAITSFLSKYHRPPVIGSRNHWLPTRTDIKVRLRPLPVTRLWWRPPSSDWNLLTPLCWANNVHVSLRSTFSLLEFGRTVLKNKSVTVQIVDSCFLQLDHLRL